MTAAVESVAGGCVEASSGATDPAALADELGRSAGRKFVRALGDRPAAHDLWGKLRAKPLHELWGLTIDLPPCFTWASTRPNAWWRSSQSRPVAGLQSEVGDGGRFGHVRELRRHTRRAVPRRRERRLDRRANAGDAPELNDARRRVHRTAVAGRRSRWGPGVIRAIAVATHRRRKLRGRGGRRRLRRTLSWDQY